jgi:hypothetical protein
MLMEYGTLIHFMHLLYAHQAVQDHDHEMKTLSSSHTEAVRALRYHLYITRGALRKIAGRVQVFKKQVPISYITRPQVVVADTFWLLFQAIIIPGHLSSVLQVHSC